MKEDHEDELARLKARVDETVEFHVREGVNQVKKRVREEVFGASDRGERKSRGERGVVGDLREVEEGERYRGTVETRRQRGRDWVFDEYFERDGVESGATRGGERVERTGEKRAEKIDETHAEVNRQLDDEREQFKIKFRKERKFMTEELEQARDEAKEAAVKLTNHHEEMKEKKMHDLTLKSQDLIDQNARLRDVVRKRSKSTSRVGGERSAIGDLPIEIGRREGNDRSYERNHGGR